MKKYLVKGALALFAGAFLFSCAEKESEYVPLAQQKTKAFDELFHEVYGDIDPYQTWGFNSGKITIDPNDSSQVIEVIDITDGEEGTNAQTRQRLRARARTRSANEEGNLWEYMGYTIPADITDDELADVLAVFNQQGAESYTSLIDCDTYFVQQVYKGDAEYYARNQYEGENFDNERKENATPLVGSDHMDWLCTLTDKKIEVVSYYPYEERIVTVDPYPDHINNFNNGNNTTAMKSEKSGREFTGITLMLNSNTDAFGYHDTENGGSDPYYYFRMEKIGDSYYVGFDYAAEGQNSNQDVRRDYIYNDWIVKIVPAVAYVSQPFEETHEVYENVWTPVEAGRVFCEDLGSTASRKDLDYNDLVFDARIWSYQRKTLTYTWSYDDVNDTEPSSKDLTGTSLSDPTYYADIKLIAAGGTIPITIANRQVHSLFVEPAAIETMVNTRDNNSTAYGSYETRDAVAIGDASLGDEYKKFKTANGSEFELWLIPGYSSISAIPIRSAFGESGSAVVELGAEPGEAPHKIMVKYGTTKWASERTEISEAYPRFGEYVRGHNDSGWVDEPVPGKIYSESVNGENSSLLQEIRSSRDVVGDTEAILWTGFEALGNTWGYASLSSPYTMEEDGFYPGDVIRFHGTVTAEGDNAPIITVSFTDDSQPYLIENMQFAEKENGSYPAEAYVGVVLDQSLCNRINNSKVNGQITLHVQGRGFTLTKIGFVPYKTTGQ